MLMLLPNIRKWNTFGKWFIFYKMLMLKQTECDVQYL